MSTARRQTGIEPPPRAPGEARDAEAPPLSPYRAFVVQFRPPTPTAQDLFTGRVEHMTSGQAARFTSLTELVAFFTQVLAAVEEKPP